MNKEAQRAYDVEREQQIAERDRYYEVLKQPTPRWAFEATHRVGELAEFIGHPLLGSQIVADYMQCYATLALALSLSEGVRW